MELPARSWDSSAAALIDVTLGHPLNGWPHMTATFGSILSLTNHITARSRATSHHHLLLAATA